jgi:2-iminoacetate synthase ThiH
MAGRHGKSPRLGMKTTATMMFGHVETLEERVDHLLLLRELQDRTEGSRPSSPGPSSPRTRPWRATS